MSHSKCLLSMLLVSIWLSPVVTCFSYKYIHMKSLPSFTSYHLNFYCSQYKLTQGHPCIADNTSCFDASWFRTVPLISFSTRSAKWLFFLEPAAISVIADLVYNNKEPGGCTLGSLWYKSFEPSGQNLTCLLHFKSIFFLLFSSS